MRAVKDPATCSNRPGAVANLGKRSTWLMVLARFPFCDRVGRLTLGMCGMHYQRKLVGTPLERPARPSWRGMACEVSDCPGSIVANGLCGLHWQRAQHGRDVTAPRQVRNLGQSCAVIDCDTPSRKRGWCVKHYNRWVKHGDPLVVIAVKAAPCCTVAGCSGANDSGGFCMSHWRRKKADQPLDTPVRTYRVRMLCTVDGCAERTTGLGLCRRHRERRNYQCNPEPYKAKTARRRYLCLLSEDEREVSDAYREAIRNDACTYCGDLDGAETDHVFPLAKGGTNHWWNLTRSCKPALAFEEGNLGCPSSISSRCRRSRFRRSSSRSNTGCRYFRAP